MKNNLFRFLIVLPILFGVSTSALANDGPMIQMGASLAQANQEALHELAQADRWVFSLEDAQGNLLDSKTVARPRNLSSWNDWRNYFVAEFGVSTAWIMIPLDIDASAGVQTPGGYVQAEVFTGVSVLALLYGGDFTMPYGARIRVSPPGSIHGYRFYVEAARTFYTGTALTQMEYNSYDFAAAGLSKSNYYPGSKSLGIGATNGEWMASIGVNEAYDYDSPDESGSSRPIRLVDPVIRIGRVVHF